MGPLNISGLVINGTEKGVYVMDQDSGIYPFSCFLIRNLSNGEVPYSDNLPEFFKIYTPALSSTMMVSPLFNLILFS